MFTRFPEPGDFAIMAKPARRRVLMLQGPASWFPTYLGQALKGRGAEVHRILLCPGDWLFWRGGARTTHFRAGLEEWPAFVDHYVRSRKITDLVCLGDGRRWHREAIVQSTRAGAQIHVIEQGYVRPACLTVEPGGTGGNTQFPRDWSQIERFAGQYRLQEPRSYRTSFAGFAAMDVAYNLANLLAGWMTHPHFRTHAIDPPLKEWAGWIVKACQYPLRRYRARRARAKIRGHRGLVFLLALQLETDFQIRHHGPPGGVDGALARVIESFAGHAPKDALMVVKPHPLDNGWARWGQRTDALAKRHAMADRVMLLDGGQLDAIFGRIAGLVTVNSTAGLSALCAGTPVLALGTAIYDLPGLTHQECLASFWQRPHRPDRARAAMLIKALRATIQVPGNFDGEGARPGAEAVAARILSGPVL